MSTRWVILPERFAFQQYRIDRIQLMVHLAFAHRQDLAVIFDNHTILPGAQYRSVAYDIHHRRYRSLSESGVSRRKAQI